MWPHQSNSPTKTWGRQRHKIFWRQRLCWLVKYVNTNLPWSQFLTLVVQSFLKNLGRERIVFPAQPVFLCFQRCFRLWSRRYCVNWSLVFPRTDSKLELRLKIQYLNKDAVNVVSESVLLAADVIEFATLGSLSNDDGDGNENGKKALGFRLAKQQLYRWITVFVYISLPLLHDYNVKPSGFTFYRGREHKTTIFFFFFWS